VKVLDFGLARWLQRARNKSSDRMRAVTSPMPMREQRAVSGDTLVLPSTSPLSADESNGPLTSTGGRRAFLATAVGITLGTPLYMSPEQARGESLTPASDMFSFGLLLQWLFTGVEPHPDGLPARDVILRVARGETLPVHASAGDVTSFITRLKAFAPTDRPTAVEAVERLKFLTEKPQRIARRSIIAALIVIALIGVWRYTVDLKAERARAVVARAEADRRRAQAEGLIEFMLGDLRKKLDPLGKLEILDDVGARAVTYVESLDPATMSADELTQSAKALNQLGEVRSDQGKTPEALAMFRRSLALVDTAVKREPRNPRALLVHGATHFWIGNSLRLLDRNDEALTHMRAYMRDGDTLAQIDPTSTEYQLERAYGHSGVALILEAKGSLAEARQHYETSLQIKDDLARTKPNDAEMQADLARAINKVGSVEYKLGELRPALAHAKQEVAIYRELVAREPKQFQWKQRLATSMAYLGRALDATGQSADALQLWEDELKIEQELALHDPTNVTWQRAVAMTRRWIAEAEGRRGNRAEALGLYRKAVDEMNAAVAKAPTRTSLAVDKAQVQTDYASLLASTDRSRALEMLRAGVGALEKLPDDRYTHYQLARTTFMLGEVLRGTNAKESAAAYERAEREIAPLVAASTNPGELALWARVLVRRQRCEDALRVLTRLDAIGYATTELRQLCSEAGCT